MTVVAGRVRAVTVVAGRVRAVTVVAGRVRAVTAAPAVRKPNDSTQHSAHYLLIYDFPISGIVVMQIYYIIGYDYT